ncbi:hypothetical protein DSD19_11030 [Rhodovulum sp. BSW8]|uniref:Uncharacterized protein n=1 Tax=Rhodovulum visakhapatnamense TaxID=364297 RepID=A0A4R8G303_9RHOB|nr:MULTISPECIES: hypothetical protein [Rhodovulum]OLS45472.1 hypothetical protein BV509_14765 [Rhodovulum sulfidophilum]MBL3568430.1 hypothetical protein [Rhodovulum visakhapatnamense]MBL3579205.1 hypothetical protein [Rhodovulum visakhapatnamense]RBO53124.1 hypothetical protein DSD19_11030 [Rhodovulum sp. BSW8]TDX33850.1 hypothetical protein EV657_101279 [Rhodovulum visakhapatnamense]
MDYTGPGQAPHAEPGPGRGGMALLIGFDRVDQPEIGMPFASARVERLPYGLVQAALSSVQSVDMVVSPLLTEQFDAMDLATQLELGGYRGLYVVVTPVVPNPEIIRREIAALCPGITVQLIPRARH